MFLSFQPKIIDVVGDYSPAAATAHSSSVRLSDFISPSEPSTELFVKLWSRDPQEAHCECLEQSVYITSKRWQGVPVKGCSVTMWSKTAIAVLFHKGLYCINYWSRGRNL